MPNRRLLLACAATALTALGGCTAIFPAPVAPPAPAVEPRPLADVTWDLGQGNGLTEAQRRKYYFMDEGIQYLPVDMIMSLQRSTADSITFKVYDEKLLAKPERYGMAPNPWNPNAPPLGITESDDDDYVPMAGINCSTCHTSLLKYTRPGGGRVAFLVDGGSSNFAVERFFPELVFAIANTALNLRAFEAFYAEYQKRVAVRTRCEASHCKDAECAQYGMLCSMSDKRHVLSTPPEPGEEAHNKELFEKEIHGDDFEDFRKSAAEHLGSDEFYRDAEKYRRHLEPLSQQLASPGGAPRPAKKKHIDWDTTLTDGAYPTADELNTPFEVWVYLIKRVLHFKDAAAYAGTSGTSSGLGRSNPWVVVKNMLAANGNPLDTLGVSLQKPSPGNSVPDASAPINTPHIWGFDRQRWVFWTGVTNSMMERNIAQGVALLTDFNWKTWETTISATQLHEISERYAKNIHPPRWPEGIFGKIDEEKAKLGQAVFVRECLGCHHRTEVTPGPGGTVDAYVNVRSDQWYFRGQVSPYYGVDLFSEVLARWMGKVKLNAYRDEGLCSKDEPAESCLAKVGPKFEKGRQDVVWRAPDANAVSAKPLHGIWATAPFLHNGAVSSLRQLLTPPERRARAFYVGDYEYDPVTLGFKVIEVPSAQTSALQPPASVYYASLVDVTKTGNGNQGHEYGTCLSDDEKGQLLEFLKGYQPDTRGTDGKPVDEARPGTPTCCGQVACGR
jgi:hypothetical protein